MKTINPILSPRDSDLASEHLTSQKTNPLLELDHKNNTQKTHDIQKFRSISISKKRLEKSYKNTMKQMREDLPIINRVFSKLIHTKYIEEILNFIISTIFRPIPILIGSTLAFITSALSYVLAMKYGYSLAGYEYIILFLIGWFIGIIFDLITIIFTSKKHR